MESELESTTKLCEYCGGINSSPRSSFCSKKCYNISYREKNKEKLSNLYKTYYRAHKAPVTKRVCEYCGELFTPNNGHQRYCTSSCQLTNWRLNNIEWNKEYGRQYREENRDKIKEYAKTYREANRGKINKEYYKKYRETHKEKIAEKNKSYRESHKEKLAAYKKKYYEANKEQIRDKKKVHYKANKEIYVERQTKYLKKIYEQCEKGTIKNTLGHKLFDYLNKKHYVTLNEAKTAFYKYNSNYVNSIYYIWINLTIEKYVIVS